MQHGEVGRYETTNEGGEQVRTSDLGLEGTRSEAANDDAPAHGRMLGSSGPGKGGLQLPRGGRPGAK